MLKTRLEMHAIICLILLILDHFIKLRQIYLNVLAYTC